MGHADIYNISHAVLYVVINTTAHNNTTAQGSKGATVGRSNAVQ